MIYENAYTVIETFNNFMRKRERADREKNSKVQKLQACEYKHTRRAGLFFSFAVH